MSTDIRVKAYTTLAATFGNIDKSGQLAKSEETFKRFTTQANSFFGRGIQVIKDGHTVQVGHVSGRFKQAEVLRGDKLNAKETRREFLRAAIARYGGDVVAGGFKRRYGELKSFLESTKDLSKSEVRRLQRAFDKDAEKIGRRSNSDLAERSFTNKMRQSLTDELVGVARANGDFKLAMTAASQAIDPKRLHEQASERDIAAHFVSLMINGVKQLTVAQLRALEPQDKAASTVQGEARILEQQPATVVPPRDADAQETQADRPRLTDQVPGGRVSHFHYAMTRESSRGGGEVLTFVNFRQDGQHFVKSEHDGKSILVPTGELAWKAVRAMAEDLKTEDIGTLTQALHAAVVKGQGRREACEFMTVLQNRLARHMLAEIKAYAELEYQPAGR